LREVLNGYTLVHHETKPTSTPTGKKEAPTDFRRLGIGIAVLIVLYFGMEFLGVWGISPED